MATAPKTNPIRISIFNHKGGVGKTTLTMNLASTLALMGKKVLLVDTDPQCNLTSYLIADDVVDQLLDQADSNKGQTLWSAVQPVSEGMGTFKLITPQTTPVDNLLLLPGDIRLSEYETDLSEFWAQCLQRKPKGFRGTTAISELITKIGEKLNPDFVLYDSGPNIGPLNRSILLDCDYFVVPVACDLFSLRALKTLGRTLVNWIVDWETISELAPISSYLLKGRPKFLGYIPTKHKTYGGSVAKQHSHYLSRIEKEIHSQIVALLRRVDLALAPGTSSQYKLGEVKDFGSLVPASQQEGLPLYQVSSGTSDQKDNAHTSLKNISNKIVSRAK